MDTNQHRKDFIMPSTYTHYALANEIIPLLPEELRNVCTTYKKQFLMGAQGPDFFYFYRPLRHNTYTKLGKQIHDTNFDELLKYMLPVLREYSSNSKEYAYVLGFITHFTLDSIFHPYVIPQVKKIKFRHTAMETEFDRSLLISHGEEPHKYPLWNAIPTDEDTIDCVSHLFYDTPKKVIRECILTYHFFRKLFYTPNKFRYYIVKAIFKPLKRREFFGNLLFSYQERPKAARTNPELHIRYQYALKEAVKNINIFHEDFKKGHPMDEIFHRNFK